MRGYTIVDGVLCSIEEAQESAENNDQIGD